VGNSEVRDLMVALHQRGCGDTSCGAPYGAPTALACMATNPKKTAISEMPGDALEQLKQHLILALAAVADREKDLKPPNKP